MKKLLGAARDELRTAGSLATAEEIMQQPLLWAQAAAQAEVRRGEILRLAKSVSRGEDLSVVFAGAGSSAFIGDALAPGLRASGGRRFASVATTDVVAAPAGYIENAPTLLVSFARSGDSPESVAAFDLYDRLVDRCSHLVVSCNPDGGLAARANDSPNALCAIMPEGSNDHGFAMTSSFSSMLVFALSVFRPDKAQLEQACISVQHVMNSLAGAVAAFARQPAGRIVALGSGCHSGIAREIALKCLELTAGRVMALHDTPLGFRHGPKSLVDRSTQVLALFSQDAHARRYDRDLADELARDAKAMQLIELSADALAEPRQFRPLDDIWQGLVYLVYGQIFALQKAIALGIGADNPFPGGEVNRVVRGVTIYSYGPGGAAGAAGA